MIKPLRDIVFIKKIVKEENKSGIILSEQSDKKQILGEVKFIGLETKIVKVSDIVFINSYNFEELEVEGEKYLVGSEKDIIGIKEND
jgi:co-chaperonin GroES (HSP10)